MLGLSYVCDEPAFAWAARLGPRRFLVLLDGSPEAIDDASVLLDRSNLAVGVEGEVDGILGPTAIRAWAARLDRKRDPLSEMEGTSTARLHGEGDGGDGR